MFCCIELAKKYAERCKGAVWRDMSVTYELYLVGRDERYLRSEQRQLLVDYREGREV